MTTVTRPDDDQAWREWRLAGITASDIAMAVSGRYGGARGVVAAKLGLTPPQEYTTRMARGHAWEDRIATAVEVLTGLHVVGEQTWAQHQHRAEWRATVDGFAAPIPKPTIDQVTHLVEEKTRGIDVTPAWDYWNPQAQWQTLVTGIPAVILAELIINDNDGFDGGLILPDLRLHLIEADPIIQADLAEMADRLWSHIQAGTLPEPTGAGELDVVKATTLIVDESAPVVDLTDMAGDVARYYELKTAIAAAEPEKKLLEAKIRAAVGDAVKGDSGQHLVSVARPIKVRTAAGNAAFLAAHPELAKPAEIDGKRAEKEAKADYAAIPREPIGARTITIKEHTS